MATITLWIPSLDHRTETLAWQLAQGGHHRVQVVTAPDNDPHHGSEHITSAPRLARLPGVTRHAPDDAPQPSDWLVIALSRHRRLRSATLDAWVARAARTGVMLEGRYHGWRDVARELVRSRPYPWRAQLLIRQHGGSVRAVYPFVRRHRQYAPYVHPQIFGSPDLMARLGPRPGGPRDYQLVFLGNREPAERGAILDRVRAAVQQAHPGLIWTRDPNQRADVFWMDYDNTSAGPRGLNPHDYLALLQRTVFCLCPAGWNGLWTHRTVEALACGAIPIVSDARDYALGLADGRDCIDVRGGRWPEAVLRALRLDAGARATLGASVARLWPEKLQPDRAAAYQRALFEPAGG